MQITVEKLNRIKVDCLFGKKKHFNAADRKNRYHYQLGIPVIIINVLSGSVLFYVLTDGVTNWVKFIPLILTFVAALLSSLQTYLNFQKKVEGHRRVGNRYLALMKRCDRLSAYYSDNAISKEVLMMELEKIATDVDDVNTEAEAFPTDKTDYLAAKKGIEAGEETYTDNELNI